MKLLINYRLSLIILFHPPQEMQERILRIMMSPVTLFRCKSKTLRGFVLISIYFNLFLNIPVNSQSDSLIKYLEIAAKNNPGVAQKFIEYKASLQKVPQVGSLSDPELSMGFFLKPMELIGGNQVADIRLMQMFPWFGVLKSAKDEMSLMANAKFEVFRDAELQVLYDVQRTWYELFKIQKEISISKKNIEILKTIERLAIVRLKAASDGNNSVISQSSGISAGSSQNTNTGAAGMQNMSSGQGNPGSATVIQPSSPMPSGSMGSAGANSDLADIFRIQMEEGELENSIALLENQFNTIRAQFNGLLNRPAVSTVYTPDEIEPDSLDPSIIARSDSMFINNPMLRMLSFEKQSIAARKNMVNRMSYPMVGLGLNYTLISKNAMSASSMNGKDMLMPMVTFTLPVYRKKYNAMQAEAVLLKTASSENYIATSNSLQSDYYRAIEIYSEAKRKVKLYENQYQLASKSFDLVLKNFSTSSSGLTDVLRVHQQVLDYELKQVEAIANLNVSIAWIKRLVAYSQIQ
jgi:outer membrane protein TolC